MTSKLDRYLINSCRRFNVVYIDTATGNAQRAMTTFDTVRKARSFKKRLQGAAWCSNVRIMMGGVGGMEVD